MIFRLDARPFLRASILGSAARESAVARRGDRVDVVKVGSSATEVV